MRSLIAFIICGMIQLSVFTVKAQENGEYKNVIYKIADKDTLMLDVFTPAPIRSGQKFPVLIIIHGGAWVEGDRTLEAIYFMRRLKEQLVKNGIAAISIDYRLAGKTTHLPAPLVDCRDAVRWVKANAAAYHLDTANVGLWGGSAGGHLALLTACKEDALWQEQESSFSGSSAGVNYVIDYFGPTDLNALLRTGSSRVTLFFARLFLRKLLPIRERLIFALTGYNIDTDKQKVIQVLKQYSPLTYINAATVPTFIFHGTKDHVVPIKQSEKLHELLNTANVRNEFIIVNKGDHGFNNISQEETEALVMKTVQYIQLMNQGLH